MFSGRPSVGGWGVGAPLSTPPLRSRRVDCMCNAENGTAKVQICNADLGRGTFLGGGGSDEDSERGEEVKGRCACACVQCIGKVKSTGAVDQDQNRDQWDGTEIG